MNPPENERAIAEEITCPKCGARYDTVPAYTCPRCGEPLCRTGCDGCTSQCSLSKRPGDTEAK